MIEITSTLFLLTGVVAGIYIQHSHPETAPAITRRARHTTNLIRKKWKKNRQNKQVT